MRIGVLKHTEKAGRDKPTHRVSKSTAIQWVTLGTHRVIDKHTIQEFSQEERAQRKFRHQDIQPPIRPTDTENFGAGEIFGIKTEGLKKQPFYPTLLAGFAFPVKSIFAR